MTESMLTTDQLAKALGVLIVTVLRMVKQGRIPAIRVGSDYRFLLPASALLGLGTVIGCDTIARTVFAPVEIPVGIIMAMVGAPFFLYLLRREA